MIYPQYEDKFNELCPPSWSETLTEWASFKNFSLGKAVTNIPSHIFNLVYNIPSMLTFPFRLASSLIYGETSEQVACRLVKEKAISLQSHDPLGRTELTRALDQNNAGAVKVYRLGSELLQRDVNFSSVLHHAANSEVSGAVRYFTDLVDVNAKDANGQTAAHIAAAKGNVQGLADLIAAGVKLNEVDKMGRTPLMLAAQSSEECFFMLVAHNPNLAARDASGKGLWHYAALNQNSYKVMNELFIKKIPPSSDKIGRTPLHDAAQIGNRAAIGHLLYYFGVQHSVDINGITPAHLAAFQGHKGAIEELAYYNCPLDGIDNLGRTPLHWAAMNGCNGAAATLIINHVNINALDRHYRTPLDLAAENNQPALVDLLIKNNADTNLIPNNNQSALYTAAKNRHDSVVRLLSAAGAPMVAGPSSLPLHEAIARGQYSKLQVSILSGADINALDPDGQTPLMLALMTGQEAMAISLMDAGANTLLHDKHHMTALHLAGFRSGSQLIKKLIESGADPFAQDIRHQTPLHCAAAVGNIEAIAALAPHSISAENGIDLPGHHGETPLHLAVSEGHKAAVQALMKLGATPLVVNNDQRTSIHLAAMIGREDLLHELLGHEASGINWKDKNEHTALYYAGIYGHENAARVLMDQGGVAFSEDKDELQLAILRADPTHIKKMLQENTPMVISAGGRDIGFHKAFELGELKVTATLSNDLAGHAIIHSKDAEQKTLLHTVAQSNDLAALRKLLELNLPIDGRDVYGKAPLHYVAENGNTEALNELAQRGANLIAQDLDGLTPLEIAIERGQYDFAERLRTLGGRILFGNKLQNNETAVALLEMTLRNNFKEVNQFLAHGANIRVKDHCGRGPLHYAVLSDQSEKFIQLFADAGVDLNASDDQGRTPLHIAIEAKKETAARELLKYKANYLIQDKNQLSAIDIARKSDSESIKGLFQAMAQN